MIKNFFFQLVILVFLQNVFSQERVVTTGVPFLMITPDARAAGMGDIGVATSADVYSQQWNPAKYVFSEDKIGLGISYTPYLSKLVDDIFLANVTFYKKNSNRSSWATSLKYFSLGDIQFNDFIGGSIIDQGIERPNELTFDLSYSLLLGKKISMAVATRFIYSDLKISSDIDASSAKSVGIDIAGFYRSDIFKISQNSSVFRAGINISNIGPRLKYDEGGQMNYIPTNLKIGSGLTLIFDSENSLAMNAEFNKLLVPSPVQFIDENNSSIIYKQPDINFLNGILESFNDAPGGISEELKEITWAIGFEYSFQNSFLLRTGYFNENEQKGSRKFFSIGTGFYLDFAKIDISYLFSRSKVRNPLENTLRFSLSFNMDKNSIIEKSNIE